MLDAPIGEGANTFIWIFCLTLGFIHALIVIDVKKSKEETETNS